MKKIMSVIADSYCSYLFWILTRIKIQDTHLFANHLAVYERENGLPKVTVYRLPAVDEPLTSLEDGRAIDFIDPVYTVDPAGSEFNSSILRFSYSSLRTPNSVYDYDMNTGTSVVKKIETVRYEQALFIYY